MPELLGRLQTALSERYRIERELGAGGMATVYLADDVRHDRRVALKVLRPELAAVIGAERFLAEIKLTANMQHPHILPLFDSGAADGYLFYVMPFVKGETLRDRMSREHQLPVADALRITIEVASALDYAHRQGVVHRDIKPENVLLSDGSALVADFGIALAASKASGARMTETGMSLGTPHYMSPEQAMGEREITPRSDVYALGAVLYEMLTGEPPFTGNTAQAVVARVLTESPRPMLPQRHTIPRHVEAAVLTALEKLPADRFATAAEFADALQDKTYTSTVSMPAAAAPGGLARGPSWRRRAPMAALGAALLLAIGAALWGWLRPAPALPVTQFSLGLRTNQMMQAPLPTGGGRIALAPDGRALAYSGPAEGGSRLWFRRFDQLDATPIAGTEGASSPFFSPDGQRIGFVRSGTTVRVASLAGAPTVTLFDKANTTSGDWGADGYIYFEVDSGIARMRASGGDVEPVYIISPERKEIATEWVRVLPGAKAILFRLRHVGQAPPDFEIVAAPVPGPNRQAHSLVKGVYATYAPSGHLLVVTAEGKLIAIPFDLKKLQLTGPPVALIEGIGVRAGGFNIDLTLANGTLAYTTGGALGSRRVMWVSRDGGVTQVDPDWDPQGVIETATLSPDGKSIAVALTRDGRRDIWIKQLPTGPFSRITFGDTSSVRPAWAPDGREVYYVHDRSGSGVGSVYVSRADGTGTPHLIKSSTVDDYGQIVPVRDGRRLVLRNAPVGAGSSDLLAMNLADTTLTPLVASPAQELWPALSPDGKWLAYGSNESGSFEIFVRPFPETTTARWQISTAGGSEPVWSSTGRELFYINGRTEMVAAEIQPGTPFSVGKQRVLFSVAPFTRPGPIPSYSVSPDDKRFLLVREGEANQQSELVVAEHWLEGLKGRAAGAQ